MAEPLGIQGGRRDSPAPQQGCSWQGGAPWGLGGWGWGGRGKAVPLGRPVVISVPVCYPPTECFSLLCLNGCRVQLQQVTACRVPVPAGPRI